MSPNPPSVKNHFWFLWSAFDQVRGKSLTQIVINVKKIVLFWPLPFKQSHGLGATLVTNSLTSHWRDKNKCAWNLSRVECCRTFSGFSQHSYRNFQGLSQDFLRTFLGLSQDFFQGFSQDFLRNFLWLSYYFLIDFSGLSQDFLRAFSGLYDNFLRTF